MIKGLGISKKPFLYLDEFCPTINWEELHADISIGLASCQWIKRYVSAGVHPNWKTSEISTYIINGNFTAYQQTLFDTIDQRDTEKKIKFASLVTSGLHPFWSCYLRVNKPKEFTGISNKSISDDCNWTDNAQYFSSLKNLVYQLPFEELGRIMCFITEPNNPTIPHFDDSIIAPARPNDDFIYFNTLSENYKKLYVMDSDTLEKFYPDEGKKLLWFNEMDYHGTDSVDRLTFTVRVEGKFIPKIKKQIIN